jgi:hypothetical protein
MHHKSLIVGVPVPKGDSGGLRCRCISASGWEDFLKSFKGRISVRASEEVIR